MPVLDLYSLGACIYQSITHQLIEEAPARIAGEDICGFHGFSLKRIRVGNIQAAYLRRRRSPGSPMSAHLTMFATSAGLSS